MYILLLPANTVIIGLELKVSCNLLNVLNFSNAEYNFLVSQDLDVIHQRYTTVTGR